MRNLVSVAALALIFVTGCAGPARLALPTPTAMPAVSTSAVAAVTAQPQGEMRPTAAPSIAPEPTAAPTLAATAAAKPAVTRPALALPDLSVRHPSSPASANG